ncbi:helix-turn-helix domain-containing protein [Odoribacter splanchnicus]|uniref:helix-turn-helix domain-containing protein n=1 Tax=Odoribacter splanchnicus TaxID=28118 RepID=UPI00189B62C7|nr:helix-turn-helix transcriptional regulator [Odoribacter splanchnicus]MDB9202340.1 helix-turn-helix transcriptional regulator [Odoribacter splanchnicus]
MKSKIQLFVSQKVTEYRTKKGWSFRYLADCMNVHHSFIQRCENPNTNKAFNLDHISKLASIFDCKIYDFLPPYPFEEDINKD